MSDTKIRIQKATQILKDDHRKVNDLFADYGDLGEGANAGKMHLFMELKRELTIHTEVEEEIFYPAIREHAQDDETRDIVAEAIEEHAIVKTLLQDLSSLTPEDEEFDVKIKALGERVLHHIEEEEKEIFPCFEDMQSEERDDVSERLRQRKLDLTEEYE